MSNWLNDGAWHDLLRKKDVSQDPNYFLKKRSYRVRIILARALYKVIYIILETRR